MIPPTQPDLVWHFGCIGRPGHYARPERGKVTKLAEVSRVWIREWLQQLDGKLHDEASDRWLTHWIEAADGSQMTLIAKRDYSVDTRPGSWCAFLMPGNSPLKTALRVAQEAFPDLKVWLHTSAGSGGGEARFK